MPKSFTQLETELIKEQLLIKGKEMFQRFGYKKFGIRELTAEVGIASGMFYKVFGSKEELLFTILENEKKEIREKINERMLAYKDQPKNALKSFYYIIMKELQENPVMKTILLKEEYSFISRNMTDKQMLEERDHSLQTILKLADYWRSEGFIKDVDIGLVISSLRSLVYLYFHKEEIGTDNYTNVINFMIDRICEYVD